MASLAPLRERPFRLFFVGRTLSGVGDSLVPVALTFAVLARGNASDLGIVLACQWGSRILFLVFGGVWSDRLPRHLVMMGADLLRGSVELAIAVLFFARGVDIAELAVGAALLGVGSAFFGPASTGFVKASVVPEHLQEANALVSVSRSAIDIGGPAVSGLLTATVGFGVVFAIDAVSFFASLGCLAAMQLPASLPRIQTSNMLAAAAEGWQAVRARRWLVAGLFADVMVNFAIGAYFVLGPEVAARHFHGARDWGFVMTAASIGGLVGSVLALRLKPSRPLLVAYALALVIPLQLLALVPPLPLLALMLGSGLVFCDVVLMNAYWVTMEQQHVPAELISRVDSLVWVASLAATPVGLAVAGPVSSALGLRAALVGAAAVAAAALMGALTVRDVRDLQATPPEDHRLALLATSSQS